MSHHAMEPPDPELEHLFEAEARFPEQPAEVKARVLSAVHATVGTLPPGGDGGGTDGGGPDGGGSDGGGPGPAGPPSGGEPPLGAPPAIGGKPGIGDMGGGIPIAPDASSLASLASTAMASGTAKLATVAMVAFTAGGVSGALTQRALQRPPEPAVSRAAPAPATLRSHRPQPAPLEPVPTEEPEEGALEAEAEALPPERQALPEVAPARPTPQPRRAVESNLAGERAIIDVARAALARQHNDAALSAIERHSATFPRGQLTEERESLRIIALAQAGRLTEAERRATAFRARYPESLFLRAIVSSLARAQ